MHSCTVVLSWNFVNIGIAVRLWNKKRFEIVIYSTPTSAKSHFHIIPTNLDNLDCHVDYPAYPSDSNRRILIWIIFLANIDPRRWTSGKRKNWAKMLHLAS